MIIGSARLITYIVALLLVKEYDFQILTLCQTPEKNAYCILECKTRDFNEPVTFAHPRTKDVGSCVTQDKCSSHYSYYNLSQSFGNEYVTKFHIAKLDRQRDEGDWACTYGNVASKTKNLTVHSTPRRVDVEIKRKNDKVLEIRCICNCLYPEHSAEIQMEISNQDKLHGIVRKLTNLKQSNSTMPGCAKDEKTLYGSIEIKRKNWPGRSIGIECFCEDSVIGHATKRKVTHIFEEPPEEPNNFECITISSNYLEIKWSKGFNGGLKQSFVIQYKGNNGNLVNVSKEDDGKTTEFSMQLTGLTPGTFYELWIYAENEWGRSDKVGVNGTTKEEIDITIPIYVKLVIPLVCCGIVSIIFTALTYCCISSIFKRMSKRDEYLRRELKYFKGNMTVYRMRNGIVYVSFWIFVVACSYAVAFTLHSVPDYVTTITCISLVLGVLLAIIFNALVWITFFINYFRHKKYMQARHPQKDQEEQIELGEKTKTLIANSKTMIKDRVDEGTFVKTKGYLEGWKKSLQYGVVMYTGTFGDGKKTNAYHIMNKWVEEYGYKPIILNKVRKVDKLITANDKFVVLINEPVKQFLRNRNVEEEVTASLQSMMTWARNGRTKIILTDQTKTMHVYGEHCRDIELFDEKFRIDLSDNIYRLTKAEKEQILRNHCKINKIEICAANIENQKRPTGEGIKKEKKPIVQSGAFTSSWISKVKQEEKTQHIGDDKEEPANENLSNKENVNAECESLLQEGDQSKNDYIVDQQLNKNEIFKESTPEKPIAGGKRQDKSQNVKKLSKKTQVKSSSSEQNKAQESQTLLNTTDQNDEVVKLEEQCKSSRQRHAVDTEPVRISEQTLHEITLTESIMGYPKTCSLFCKSKKFTILGLSFFVQPSERIIEEIDQLNSKGKEYEVLRALFKENGKTRFQNDKYKTAFENLKGVYITQDEDGNAVFINNSVYVAFGLSLAKKEPKTVLEECNWNFLKHHTKIDGEEYIKDVTYLTITPKLQPIIKTKFLKDLTLESANRCCGYISRLGKEFLKDTLDEAINDSKLNMRLRESCTMERGVFVQACKYENPLLMVELWNRYKNYIPKNVVEDCRRLMKNEPLKVLLTQWMDKDTDG